MERNGQLMLKKGSTSIDSKNSDDGMQARLPNNLMHMNIIGNNEDIDL